MDGKKIGVGEGWGHQRTWRRLSKEQRKGAEKSGEPPPHTQALYPASKLRLQPMVTLTWLPLLPVPMLVPFPGAAKAPSAIQTP